jgi:hypothetical protein
LHRPEKFTSFLAKNPDGRIIEDDRVIQSLSPDLAVDSGSYIFEVVSSVCGCSVE